VSNVHLLFCLSLKLNFIYNFSKSQASGRRGEFTVIEVDFDPIC
jgi:hypothetical protein